MKQLGLLFALVVMMASCQDSNTYDALIITGQNNHDWETSHVKLKSMLEKSKLFKVDVQLIKEGETDKFVGNFSNYDVIVMDYNGELWSEKTQKDFEEYMKAGGGMVVYHASSNTFPEWEAYNEMIGLGAWGERDEKSGPYLYWEDGKVVTNDEPGIGGTHPPAIEFVVETRDTMHPITAGLPAEWLHTEDELYSLMRGPAKNLDLLATAYCDEEWERGTGRNEPVLFTVKYGEGRIFHTILGHGEAVECTGFIVTLLRGTEWAASGTVTQQVPIDFPNAYSTNTWKSLKAVTFDEMFLYIEKYEVGKSSNKHLNMLKLEIRKATAKGQPLDAIEDKMLALLQSPTATIDGKVKICHELSYMGSKEKAIPVLTKISQESELKEAADYAMERINNN